MDRQARLDEGGFTFQQMLKPSVNPYLARAEHDARANDSRNELLLINEAHWRNAHNTNHRL